MLKQDCILEIKNLNVKFPAEKKHIHAVNGVDLKIKPAETIGVVGESGCGKSVTLFSILRLLKSPPAIVEGRILFQGRDILKLRENELYTIRGKEVAMIFQEPMTSLNPVMKIGNQIMEALIIHEKLSKAEAVKRTIQLLELVEIPDAKNRIWNYPHQLSGGMRQRVMIAMALACKPKILLADEPTTALDVTTQAQILELLKQIKKSLNTSIVFVSHDLAVVAEIAEKIVVFYAGKIVEESTTVSLFKNPVHPYTKALFGCMPLLNTDSERLSVIEGSIPDPTDLPTGCVFYPRCKYSIKECSEKEPKLSNIDNDHRVACHRAMGEII
ncbi:ABC transporter ATP-binding protein [Tepidanaerobacter syntrophicus]|uniref:ABC transporter ATP-binding protein n=1 Tax=Tepidanaerobacter syntrophicus TaxID=224999 RepID=UPI001BD43D1D|nr:ABC transporter ATP-binding protein [Tepidanaerobacter syntrophicus]